MIAALDRFAFSLPCRRRSESVLFVSFLVFLISLYAVRTYMIFVNYATVLTRLLHCSSNAKNKTPAIRVTDALFFLGSFIMRKVMVDYIIGRRRYDLSVDVAASPEESKNAMKTNDLIPQHLTLRFYIIK